MIEDIRNAFDLLSPATRRRWASLLPLSVAAAVAETAGAVAVFGLLRIVTDPAEVTGLPIASRVLPWLPRQDPRTIVLTFTLLVMALYLVRNGVLAVAGYLRERVTSRTVLELSRHLLGAYLRAPYAFCLQRNSATLIQRVQASTETIATLVLAPTVNVATEVLVVAGLVALLALTAPFATLVAVVATLVLLLVPSAFTRRIFRHLGEADRALDQTTAQHLHQSLGAAKEVRMSGREAFFLERFDRDRARLAAVRRRKSTLSDLLRLMLETVFILALLLVIALLTVGGTPGQHIVSVMGLYAYAGFRLVPSANRITLNINFIRHGRAFVRDVCADVAALGARATPKAEPSGILPFRETIAFDGVSYVYEASSRPALRNVTLMIRRGESVGVVGPTGAGKSTLVDVLLGLLEPTEGRVLVDGADIRDGLRAWQRQVGYVPQSFYLLDDTVRANVCFGLEAAAIDEQRLARAVRLAQLDEVVASLPQGLATTVGERGTRLSGGQRQRIAIARALYDDPSVLVFDEATAALDPQTEREIIRAVETLQRDRTIIVIAHRLSTVRRCDRIVYLRDGQAVSCGTFEDLIASDASFREMARATV